MELEPGKKYVDRRGLVWEVLSVRWLQRGSLAVAARWEGTQYRTRHFRWDGRYLDHKEDPWDLVALA